MPFFSIIVPTRNRAKLLVESAIPSIVDQDFDDYEIVICDNNSSDNTKELVENLMKQNPKIRYIYSPIWIPKEKFFEFSMKQARGEYLILFFDDDVFVKNTLNFCYSILSKFQPPILTFSNRVVYYYPDWCGSNEKNMLKIPFHTEEILIKDSKKQLEKIFDNLDLLPGTPDVTNSFYSTSFILELIEKYKTLFPFGHMGDYNIACYTLANIEYYVFYDGPIIIFGHWSQNTTQQLRFLQTTMDEYKEWVDWIKQTLLKDMPFKEYIFSNCIAATLYKMGQQLNLPYTIDYLKYVKKIYFDILYIKKFGIDVSYVENKFFEFLKKEKIEIEKILKEDHYSSEIFISNFFSTKIYKGYRYGFNNIFEARGFFEKIKKKQILKPTLGVKRSEKFFYQLLKFGSKITLKLLGVNFQKKVLKIFKKISLYILQKEIEDE
ncbi:MAG: glycosyltransferase [Candidatus Omnitrophica bacterium]|nr:glycosyltransferase [Candidatus Omnitrophota bacterium]